MAGFDAGQQEAKVSIYGTNVAPGDTAVSLDASGRVNTNLASAVPSGANLIGSVKITDAAGTNQAAIDASGNVSVKVSAPLPAGTNIVGKFSIDQTTPGTTNAVEFTNTTIAVTGTFWQPTQPVSFGALPTGTALIGKVGIDQTTPGTTNGVQINAALPAGANAIGAVSDGAPLATSLNAVTATGAGTTSAYAFTRKTFGLQVVVTGAPTVVLVNLEGSNDGAHWFKLGAWSSALQTSGDMIFVSDMPVLNVRANLATLTGGTTPSVTATLSAV